MGWFGTPGRVFLAWCNLKSDLRRLALAAGGIGFAVLLMLMQLGFRDALFDSVLQLPRQFDADLVVHHPSRYTLAATHLFPRARLNQILGDPDVVSAEPLYIEDVLSMWTPPAGADGAEPGRRVPLRVLGFDPRRPVLLGPDIRAQLGLLESPYAILFDRRSKNDYGQVAVGTRTDLAGKPIEVVGLFDLGTDFAYDGNAILSDRTYALLFPALRFGASPLDDVDYGLVRLADGADADAVCARLRRTLPGDVTVSTKRAFMAAEYRFWSGATPIGIVFGFGTIMGFVVGTIICYQILYSDIADHIREFATLKAIGYQNTYFIKVVLQEAAILSLLGFLPGLLVSWALYALLSSVTGLVLAPTVERSVWVLGLTLAMCVVSGCLTMRRVLAADPAELF